MDPKQLTSFPSSPFLPHSNALRLVNLRVSNWPKVTQQTSTVQREFEPGFPRSSSSPPQRGVKRLVLGQQLEESCLQGAVAEESLLLIFCSAECTRESLQEESMC